MVKALRVSKHGSSSTLLNSKQFNKQKKRIMKYQFKTNIMCNNCIAKVTPYLNANNDIKHWEVDITNPNKILTIETDNLTGEIVREIVKNAGYSAENLS
jgi:copper chaperone